MGEKNKKTRTRTKSFGAGSRISHDASRFYESALCKGLPREQDFTPLPDNPFPEEHQNKIFLKSSEKMSELPDRCVHLMVTSPPYNATKDYDQNLSLDQYLAMLRRVFAEVFRVLVHGGRACVNVANLGRKPYLPLSDYISLMMTELGFLMRGEIIWHKAAGAGVSMAWGSWKSAANPVLRDTHEYILVFSKGAFSRKKPRNKKNTITREQFMEWTKSVWNMNPESARRVGHPAPFPVELPFRLIQLYTFSGDVVLDPFMGSGTTAVAALRAGRKFVGYELEPGYVEIARKRIAAEATKDGRRAR